MTHQYGDMNGGKGWKRRGKLSKFLLVFIEFRLQSFENYHFQLRSYHDRLH